MARTTEMTDAHLQQLEAVLLKDWNAAMATFATSPNNVRVYALAVQLQTDYPEPVLALNTEPGFDRIVARYPNEPPAELRRLGGPRWNPAEFVHFDIAPHSAVTRRLADVRLNAQLTARALHALRPSMFPSARFSDKTNHLLTLPTLGLNEAQHNKHLRLAPHVELQ